MGGHTWCFCSVQGHRAPGEYEEGAPGKRDEGAGGAGGKSHDDESKLKSESKFYCFDATS